MSPPAIFGDAANLSRRLAAFTRPRQRAPSSGPPTPAKATDRRDDLKTPRLAPRARAKGDVTIKAKPECGRDYSWVTPKWRVEADPAGIPSRRLPFAARVGTEPNAPHYRPCFPPATAAAAPRELLGNDPRLAAANPLPHPKRKKARFAGPCGVRFRLI